MSRILLEVPAQNRHSVVPLRSECKMTICIAASIRSISSKIKGISLCCITPSDTDYDITIGEAARVAQGNMVCNNRTAML